jgi:hypothetical protein
MLGVGERALRRGVVLFALLVALGGLSLIASVWAAPDQVPERATVPTRTKTHTPGPSATSTHATQATMTPRPTFSPTHVASTHTPTHTTPTRTPTHTTPTYTPTPSPVTATGTPSPTPTLTPVPPSATPTGLTPYPDGALATATLGGPTRTPTPTRTPSSTRTGTPAGTGTGTPFGTSRGVSTVTPSVSLSPTPARGGATGITLRAGTAQEKLQAGAPPQPQVGPAQLMTMTNVSQSPPDPRQRTLVAKLFKTSTGLPTYNPSRAGDPEETTDQPNGWLLAGGVVGVGLVTVGTLWFRRQKQDA